MCCLACQAWWELYHSRLCSCCGGNFAATEGGRADLKIKESYRKLRKKILDVFEDFGCAECVLLGMRLFASGCFTVRKSSERICVGQYPHLPRFVDRKEINPERLDEDLRLYHALLHFFRTDLCGHLKLSDSFRRNHACGDPRIACGLACDDPNRLIRGDGGCDRVNYCDELDVRLEPPLVELAELGLGARADLPTPEFGFGEGFLLFMSLCGMVRCNVLTIVSGRGGVPRK